MTWIKVETNLYDKTEVFALSHYLNTNRAEVLGLLVVFWAWADKNTADGTLRANRKIIDTVTKDGFANAMVDVGWLDFIEDGEVAELPNYDRHNGTSAKKRATSADRVRKYRNAQSVSREEKIREDKEKKKKGGWDGA